LKIQHQTEKIIVENHTVTSCSCHAEVRENNAYYRKAWADYEAAREITYSLQGGDGHPFKNNRALESASRRARLEAQRFPSRFACF